MDYKYLKIYNIRFSEIILWYIVFSLFIFLAILPLAQFVCKIESQSVKGWFFVITMCGFIVVHELIHALSAAILSGIGFKAIKLGITKKGMPYCHPIVPLTVKHFKLSAIMPLIITGILPFLVGVIMKSYILLIISSLMIVGAVGDIVVYWKLRREDNNYMAEELEDAVSVKVFSQ